MSGESITSLALPLSVHTGQPQWWVPALGAPHPHPYTPTPFRCDPTHTAPATIRTWRMLNTSHAKPPPLHADAPPDEWARLAGLPLEGVGSSSSSAGQGAGGSGGSSTNFIIISDPNFSRIEELLAGLDFAFPAAKKIGEGMATVAWGCARLLEGCLLVVTRAAERPAGLGFAFPAAKKIGECVCWLAAGAVGCWCLWTGLSAACGER